MRNLKQALGKNDQLDLKSHKCSQNIKNMKDNHGNSKWMLAINSDDSKGSSDDSMPIANLVNILSQANQKGKINYQQLLTDILNSHKVIKAEVSQKQNLKGLQRLLQSNLTKFPIQIKQITLKINQTIKEKIKKIESKDFRINQQIQLMQKRLFKKVIVQKPQQQIQGKHNKNAELNKKPQIKHKKMKISENKSASINKNQGSGSQDSGQGKLSKLLNSITISNESKKSDSGQNCQEEGYSFSAVMNASSTVKPRESKIQKQQLIFENEVSEEYQDDEHTNIKDEAFIFFRPKKVKK